MSLLLAVDVGNTNVVLGIFDLAKGPESPLVCSWRLATSRERTVDEYGVSALALMRHQGIEVHVQAALVRSTAARFPLLAAFLGIGIYVAFRFEWKFSLGSIAALTHDAIMTLGFLSLIQEEYDLTVLAGILAMLGYSNNETIVIFDRIRENLIGLRKRSVHDIINLSINQTLLRSIITHFTVLMVLSSLYFFGGKSVHGFSVAMIVGVLVATYSSIYVSSGVTVLLNLKREDLLPPEEKDEKLKAEKLAKAENDGAVV